MRVQAICNFHKDPIKTKQAMLWTRWNTVWSGQNSNSSEILCMSMLSASCIQIRLKLKGYAPDNVKYSVFVTRGQETLMWIVRSSRNSNLSEVLWLSGLPASLKMVRSKVKVLSAGQHFLHLNKSMGIFFVAQGWVTPKWIVRSGPKSNSSEILPASMTKIRSKMKPLSSGQGRIWGFSKLKLVTPKRIFRSSPCSNFAEILHLSWLPARLMKIR